MPGETDLCVGVGDDADGHACSCAGRFSGGSFSRFDGEFFANPPVTFPSILPVSGIPSFLIGCDGAAGGDFVVKNGFFAKTGGRVHSCFGVACGAGACLGILCCGAFGTGCGGVHDPVFFGIEPSSESSCSKKSDIEKG